MEKNETKNTNGLNEKQAEQAIIALAKELAGIKQANRLIIEKTNAFLIKAIEHCKKHGDTSLFKKVFFIKAGNGILYHAIGLKSYFEDNGVCFVYNVKKDSLRIFGEWKDIKETFKEYRERIKAERQAERLAEKPDEKITRLFKNKIDALTDAEKTLLKNYIKTI